jgi:hypothetical protein
MGVVWLARDDELERLTAIKFLPELIMMDAEALRDLKRETRRNLDITHANIVRIYDFEQDATLAGVTMEYVEGETLGALKVKSPNGCLDVETVAPWLVQICDALHYAHTKPKVAHRDLKPANIMLQKDGEIKVTDFGIASSISDTVSRVSMSAGSSGTPVFMSPQQALGERPTARDDIYSLGATIYDLLTGKPPFYTGQLMHQLERVVPPLMRDRRVELEKSGNPIPEAWEEVVAACLAKNPADRPSSIKEVGERLAGAWASGGAVPQVSDYYPISPEPQVDSGTVADPALVQQTEEVAVTPEVWPEATATEAQQEEQPLRGELPPQRRRGLWIGLAAVVALVLGVGWMMLPNSREEQVKSLAHQKGQQGVGNLQDASEIQQPSYVSPVTSLLEQAQDFREAASLDLAYAAQKGGSEKVLKPFMKGPVFQDKLAWPLFFQGTLMFAGHLGSDAPLIAYYNVIYDVAFITQWRLGAKGWEITQVAVRQGVDLQGKERPSSPRFARWLRSGITLQVAMQKQYAQFQSDWNKLHPANGEAEYALTAAAGDADTLSEFEGQLEVGLERFRMIHEGDAAQLGQAAAALCQALRENRADDLRRLVPANNPITVAEMLKIPEESRAAMRTCYAILTPEKWLVFLVPPNQPNLLGIYELTSKDMSGEEYLAATSAIFFDIMAAPQSIR